MPSGSSGPNRAYRLGMRATVLQIAQELGVRRPDKFLKAQSVLCQNPVGTVAGRRLAATGTAKRMRAGTRVSGLPSGA